MLLASRQSFSANPANSIDDDGRAAGQDRTPDLRLVCSHVQPRIK
jgi:hypothetical protein